MPEQAQTSNKQPPQWLFKFISKTHVALNRATGGKLFNKLGGDEVCFVTMLGAKSGKWITIPLMYVPYREGVLLVASKGGAPKNPVWYNSIFKNPDIEVRYRGAGCNCAPGWQRLRKNRRSGQSATPATRPMQTTGRGQRATSQFLSASPDETTLWITCG